MPNCSRICSMTLAVFALRSMWITSVSGTVSGHPATAQLGVRAADMSFRYLAATHNLYSPVCARELESYRARRVGDQVGVEGPPFLAGSCCSRALCEQAAT